MVLTLPTPGGDNNTWGTELNDYIEASGAGVYNVLHYGGDLQATYDALPDDGGYIVVPPGRYDVDSGLNLDRLKPVVLRGVGRWTRAYRSAGASYPLNDPVIYASGTPEALINFTAPDTLNNAYGFSFENLVFELGEGQLYAIDGFGVNDLLVNNCNFWTATDAEDGVIALRAWVDEVDTSDCSWWRITNNHTSGCALAILGTSGSNSNQHYIAANVCFGKGKAEDTEPAAITLIGSTRSIVTGNNIENYNVGIKFDTCEKCSEFGDGGESVETFILCEDGAFHTLAPIGVSVPAAADNLVYIDACRDVVIFSGSIKAYEEASANGVEFAAGSSWYADETTWIAGRNSNLAGITKFTREAHAVPAIQTQGQITSGGANWDGGHFVMGAYHLWVDATGDLRIKSSAPGSDLDGTVVGAQT